MNVLVVGEFSGFAKHLKNGFKKLGHQVTIVMTPDSFKKFKGDDDDILYDYNSSLFGYPIKGTGRLLKPFRSVYVRLKLRKKYFKKAPECIVVINYGFLTATPLGSGVPISFLETQLKKGSKLIMLCCGGDPAYKYTYRDLMKVWGREVTNDQFYDRRFSWLLQKSNTIIPMAVSYYDAIKNYVNYEKFDITKVQHSIPPPMTVDSKCIINPCYGRKIVVFHGIVRPKEKGTNFIMEAMDRIQQEMPDKVECFCLGGMPYDEYVKLFDRVDILVDQTYGDGFGMQALIGAMKGKCVLVSNSEDNNKDMGFENVPFVQIGPNSEQIYQTLKGLILNPKQIDEIKLASRKFVKDYCDCCIVAERYLETVDL